MAASLLACVAVSASAQSPGETFLKNFAAPPADARPMMRWWWFGPAVEDRELARELRVMQQAGIGGVEIQPVYPLSLDDPEHGIRNLPYLSPEFLSAVRFANTTARSLGLRVDITLGSGWPYGGPATTLALSAGRLKLVELPVGGQNIALPQAGEGDSLLAVFTVPGAAKHWDPSAARRLPVAAGQGVIQLPSAPAGPATLLLFYASHTRQQVKRPAIGAEGFVIDHFARPAIEEHISDVADKLAIAFDGQPPYSVFSDSLEVYGSDWTPSLPAEFQRRRGYDLIPHLPELYAGGTPLAEAVRNDWGRTLSELIRENYLTPLKDWATQHKTQFRSQTYGEPAVTLADEAIPSLPEGEGPQWRQFSFTRWASSASHLYQRNVTSAETFTWLHSPVFSATPLDMKVEADRMFLSGVNQVIGHGWPYTPPSVADPGWNLYAAAVFDDKNPWFAVMPDIAKYMQRASWMLRQGKPANDVAILLPEDDAQAAFSPGHVSVTDEMKKRISPELMRTILDAGYNLDYIDAATIDKQGTIAYPIVVLPPTTRMPVAAAHRLADYVASGGRVIALGATPTLAPGLGHEDESSEVAATLAKLFASPGTTRLSSITGLAAALHKALPPDLTATSLPDPARSGNDSSAGLGFIHRVLVGSQPMDLYFVVNSANTPLSTNLSFRAVHRTLTTLSLDSGTEVTGRELPKAASVAMTFAPYESKVFLLSDVPAKPRQVSPSHPIQLPAIDSGWTIQFAGSAVEPLAAFVPVDTMPGRRFFSGEITYARTITLDRKPPSGTSILLDFGKSTPTIDARRPGASGIRALVDQPIRDAAIVVVNGKRAGSIWHPPYAIDIAPLLNAGANTMEVHVFNTAVNELAGQPPRDYTALNAKYGKRFDPQDMDLIRPLPSGLLTAPTLRTGEDIQ
jgi:hypothetical protein